MMMMVVLVGQQSEGSSVNSGTNQKRVYQGVTGDSVPADPPDVYNTTDSVYEDDFGDWEADIDDVASSYDYLWVANSGTKKDADNNIINLSWQKYVTLAQQYTPVVQDNDAYTTSLETDSRFVRDRLPDGSWGPWVSLVDAEWVEIVNTDIFHRSNATITNQVFTLPAPFNAENYTEIEIEVRAFGSNTPRVYGAGGIQRFRRQGANWTNVVDLSTNLEMDYGVYKLRINDQVGLNVVQVNSDETSGVQQTNVVASDPTQPFRRVSIAMALIGASSTQPNLISYARGFNFESNNARIEVTIRMK